MNHFQLFNVSPAMPEGLGFIETLSRNLWWCWNHDAIDLFQRVDPALWRQTRHTAIEFLERVPPAKLEALSKDEGFVSHLRAVEAKFTADVLDVEKVIGRDSSAEHVAYFSLEYGIHESMRIYSGGLGCLAGDHLKSASDTNMPLIAVGLFYRQGYFQQYLNDDGWQQEAYRENEVNRLPLRPACSPDGTPVSVDIPLPGGENIHATVWRLDVGSVPLFLLDANNDSNTTDIRQITARLYEPDRVLRLRQEILLGIGGVVALSKLGYTPSVFHMNEGHAAFLSLARVSQLMKTEGLHLNTALEFVSRTGVFTTHTPVPAGNETFSTELVKAHVDALEPEYGVSSETVLEWGRGPGEKTSHEHSMTIMALNTAQLSNGVSQLHGVVARDMWKHLWPKRPTDEVPIGAITNGVHMTSWLSTEMIGLFDKYLPRNWRAEPYSEPVSKAIDSIPDDALWRAHQGGRSRLVRWARVIAEEQSSRRSATRSEIRAIKSSLDFDALTIGFARRFATYKRASMLLRDKDRLIAMLTNSEKPIQFLFAGKAHPADDSGKDLIRQVVHFGRETGLSDRFIFIENYDILIARHLVQGVDVWLNNPRRPLEASGTSGMKSCLNGGLHLSTLDGWWDEGYSPECGWAIGDRQEFENHDYQDQIESHSLYNLLENEVLPTFYDRPNGDIPTRWVAMMKESIRSAVAEFSSHRMVDEYNRMFYKVAAAEKVRLYADHFSESKALVKTRDGFKASWEKIRVSRPSANRDITGLHVGDEFTVTTHVALGELKPADVRVEVYHGPVDTENTIVESHSGAMQSDSQNEHGEHVYQQTVQCKAPGRYGFTVRVRPAGNDWNNIIPGFITWAE
jgi:starch phosphorylase